MIAYIALFSALLSRLTALVCGSAWVTSFHSAFLLLNIHRSGVLTALAWLVPQETAAVSAQVLCTPYNHAPCHFMQSHIRKVYACLAVTCHLHFWQNDRDLLRATAVTRGWNGYRNESQHRKSTLEKKILPPFQQGFEPATFQSRVRRSNHWAIPYSLLSLTHSLSSRPIGLSGPHVGHFVWIQPYSTWVMNCTSTCDLMTCVLVWYDHRYWLLNIKHLLLSFSVLFCKHLELTRDGMPEVSSITTTIISIVLLLLLLRDKCDDCCFQIRAFSWATCWPACL